MSPGKDQIDFNFAALGNNPAFASKFTLNVLDEVTIQGPNLGGGKSVTIGGDKPFVFSHQRFFDNPPVGDPGMPPPTPSSTIFNVNFVTCKGDEQGGAVEVSGGDLVLNMCRFEGNSATQRGGAVMVGPISQLTANNCVLVGNAAPNGGAVANTGRVVLSGSNFTQNRAKTTPFLPVVGAIGGYGGAIHSTGVVTADGTVFALNCASLGGGGVYIANPSKAVENASTFTGGQFDFNEVTTTAASGDTWTGDGGGVCVSSGFVKVSGTMFDSNGAGSGGGVSAGANSTVEIKSATFKFNKTPQVGGQYQGRAIDVKAGASVSVQGSTLTSNGIRGTYYNNGGNTFTNSPDE
jgi:hypothetical protein